MELIKDCECSVCFERFSRSKHVPRVLFCNHTFCSPCLNIMATQRGGMLSVRCPLCRQVSCIRHGLTLEEALLVNSHLWDHMAEDQKLQVKKNNLKEEIDCKGEERRRAVAEAASLVQPQCRSRSSSEQNHLRLRLPGFLKRMIVPRQTQESIVLGCNVMSPTRHSALRETGDLPRVYSCPSPEVNWDWLQLCQIINQIKNNSSQHESYKTFRKVGESQSESTYLK